MHRDEVIKALRQLPRLRLQVERMENALAELTEEEAHIITTLFVNPKRNGIESLCEMLEIERTSVYRRRNKALKKLGDLLKQ